MSTCGTLRRVTSSQRHSPRRFRSSFLELKSRRNKSQFYATALAQGRDFTSEFGLKVGVCPSPGTARRPVVSYEFERACRLSKLLHPGFPTL